MTSETEESAPRKIKVGSRKSQLALIQTEHVIAKLKEIYPSIEFEIVKMSTLGDNVLDKALSKIGEKALFTKELEVALEKKEVDFVVHSLKDLPTTLPEGMVIGAILEREDPRDAVILKEGISGSLEDLASGSVLGTSSLRRTAQLKSAYPHLDFLDVRGNLNTRLSKLDAPSGPYSALVLAVAGVSRLGLEARISTALEQNLCMHAVGQGALAVECREGDTESLSLLAPLHHRETVVQVVAERALMRTLEGGCSVPVAVHTTLTQEGVLALRGGVWSLDGAQKVVEETETCLGKREEREESPAKKIKSSNDLVSGVAAGLVETDDLKQADACGVKLAKILIAKGASEILAQAREGISTPINQPPSR